MLPRDADGKIQWEFRTPQCLPRLAFSRARRIGTESADGSIPILFTATSKPLLAKYPESFSLVDSAPAGDDPKFRHWFNIFRWALGTQTGSRFFQSMVCVPARKAEQETGKIVVMITNRP